MEEYLNQIRHAVERLLQAVWKEHADYAELHTVFLAKRGEMNAGYAYVERMIENPDLDDEGLGTAAYWDTYFGPDKEQHNIANEMDEVARKIEILAFSRSALAGSILQFAKQGLSIAFGDYHSIPDGRTMGNIALKELIWQGRNHAIHWEEGEPRKAIIELFEKLIPQFGQFNNFKNSNCSFELIEILEWVNWEKFEADLRSF